MGVFNLRTAPQIIADMISKVTSETQITDVNDGSVVLTLMEASAIECANAYIQMMNVILKYNIDNLTGTDLDARAFEYGLVRLQPKVANGYVSFFDTSFTKVQTNIYNGLPGPSIGGVTVNAVSATGFTPTGSIIVGRNSNNTETVAYLSIVPVGTYFVFNINPATPFTKDHGTDETIILSQGGIRTIPAGTDVYAPAGDSNPRIDFILQTAATILDGETQIDNNTVVCTQKGSIGNVGAGRVNTFNSIPFPNAHVTNPQAFSTGSDTETDSELRERIKNYVQSLSRGVIIAIVAAANAVFSDEQQNKVFSAKFVEATTLNDLNYLFIDDGTGLEPIAHNVPYKLVMSRAAGTEKFLHLDPTTTPLMKAPLISQNASPYNIPAGHSLTISVDGEEETITFLGVVDFADPSKATADEVALAINNRMNSIEARTTGGRKYLLLQPKINNHESIACVAFSPSNQDANSSLGFVQGNNFYTLNLYLNDRLLVKDGEPAFVDCQNNAPFTIPGGATLTIIIDGKVANVQTITFAGPVTTAAAVVNVINGQLSGGFASVVRSGAKVRITSTNPNYALGSVQVTGGTANTGLGRLNFPTTVFSGKPKDYVLNKYNGQIELTNPLNPDDEVTAGSNFTGAFIESINVGPYSVLAGQLLVFQVDDIVNSSITTNISTTNFRDSSLIPVYPIANHFNGLYVRFKNTTATVALRNVARLISAYDPVFGQLTTAAFPVAPAIGDTYEIVEIVTIPSNQTLSAAAMAAFLNPLLTGAYCYARTKGNGNVYLRIASNTLGSNGKIRIHEATTAVGLFLPVDILAVGQNSNFAFVESGNEQLFTIGYNQNLIIIVDHDPINKTFDITTSVHGTVTTSTSNVQFNAIALATPYPITNLFSSFRCRFSDTTPTAALRGVIRTITTYNGVTGQININPATPFPAVPAVNDIFDLIPTTAKNVCDLFSLSSFSGLAAVANITPSSDGTRVQISSKKIGSDGGIQIAGGTANNFLIPFTSNGTGAGQTTTSSIEGLSVGLQCIVISDVLPALNVTISNIVGAIPPYTLTFTNDAGGAISLAGYNLPDNARILPRNQFNFFNAPNSGVDGYKYYGGLIQQVQWTEDGRDDDLIDYPGIKAAGVQIEVNAPTLVFVTVTVNITTIASLAVAAVSNDVKAAISSYVNSLGVGKEVIISEIIANVLSVYGVIDVKVISPTANIIIQDHELARINETSIFVS